MANFNRSFGSNTPARRTDDDNDTANTKREEAKTGVEVGAGVGDSAPVKKDSPRSSSPASTRVETQTKAPSGVNQEVWQQAEAQVVSTFGGLDDKAKVAAVQSRYDSMVASDEQVKKWSGGDKEILGDVGQK